MRLKGAANVGRPAPVAFAAALMRKDLDLALSVAGPAGLPLPVASATHKEVR